MNVCSVEFVLLLNFPQQIFAEVNCLTLVFASKIKYTPRSLKFKVTGNTREICVTQTTAHVSQLLSLRLHIPANLRSLSNRRTVSFSTSIFPIVNLNFLAFNRVHLQQKFLVIYAADAKLPAIGYRVCKFKINLK
jgi:hypothetical protein